MPSKHRIRNSIPGGLRPSTLPLGHGGSPQYWLSHVDGEETYFVSFKPPRPNRTPNSGVKGSGANHYPRAPAHHWNKRDCIHERKRGSQSGEVQVLLSRGASSTGGEPASGLVCQCVISQGVLAMIAASLSSKRKPHSRMLASRII